MNNKLIIGAVVAIILAGGVVLLSKGSTGKTVQMQPTISASSPKAAPSTVVMKDLDFGPMELTVKKGTEVTWSNQDTASHTITFDDKVLAGSNSRLIAPGGTYKHTFAEAGTYSYHCTPHPFMKASITVTN